tara:strand:- start:5633 stop:5884 length:252 start_codon:yes stop_codon:yes gene_type:complete
MENNIIINPYLFYGLIGAIAYLLWLTRWLNKMLLAVVSSHQLNTQLVTDSFELIAKDNQTLSEGLDRLEGQIEYIAQKEDSTS